MIKDSGKRTEFETGAKRDIQHGKGRMDLLPWYGIIEVSKHCEEGADKYGEHNVDRGIPLHSLCDSAARHLAKFIAGEMDEDHLRAAAWNLLWALNQRTTHPELDDLYSHKEKVERVRTAIETIKNAKANGELVFDDGPDTINEECSGDIPALTRDEILQRCRDAEDVYVVGIGKMAPWRGWCYLQLAIPNDLNSPLSVFMHPLNDADRTSYVYTPELFEVYDCIPEQFRSLELESDISKEPNAIEPLSKELLLSMNGRFVFLVDRDRFNVLSVGWVRVSIENDKIYLVKEDEEHNDVSKEAWSEAYTRCFICDPFKIKEE